MDRNTKNGFNLAGRVATGSGSLPRRLLPAILLGLLSLMVCIAVAQAQEPETVLDRESWQGYEAQPLRVNVWNDRDDDEVYRYNEPVRIHFEVNRDAYVVVFRIDTEGEVSLLWPRSRYDDGFAFGTHVYNLPVPGASRIRTGESDGVEYVEAMVSAYPFDLRSLEVDFHHEPADVAYAYYVAGDPFLAMNDVNFAITGLEDPEDYVATNYISYYVGREVEYPRYLCGQCHDDTVDYRPYRDTCIVQIHHDYGWSNTWYDRYGYYPAYYYPVYYYVDPWTMRPWINYWYRPWYGWPSGGVYGWDYDFYVWSYSPYWRGDMWARYESGQQRYRPISKGVRYKTLGEDVRYRNPRDMVKSGQPTSKMTTAMAERRPLVAKTAPGEAGVTHYKDNRSVTRRPEPLTGTRDTQALPSPGIRFDRPTIGGGTVQRPADPGSGSGAVRSRPASNASPGNDVKPAVRPVTPRNKGSQIWNGGRTAPQTDRKVSPKPVPDKPRDIKPVDPQRQDGGAGKVTPAQPVKSPDRSKATSKTKATSKPKPPPKSNKSTGNSQGGKSPAPTKTTR